MQPTLPTSPPATQVSFKNARGEVLCGTLHGPVRPVVAISCHGMFSTKDGPKHLELARHLQPCALPLLRFDFAGHGASQGSLANLSYSNRMQDLDAALHFLGGLGARRFVLFGSSMGGAVALLCAARDERVVAVATMAAIGCPTDLVENYPEAVRSWERRGFFDAPQGRIDRAFLDDSRAHDVIAAIAILRAPVLIIHGELDEIVAPSQAHDLATAARNASLDLVCGADHAFSDPTHLRASMVRAAAFLAGHARPFLREEQA